MSDQPRNLRTRVQAIEAKLDQRFDGIDKRFEALDSKMGVLYEDLRDQIKQLAEALAATQALLDRRYEALMARLDEQIVPVGLAVRYHSRVIEHHNLTPGPEAQ